MSERRWTESDTMGGESRFWSMQNDIDITAAVKSKQVVVDDVEVESDHLEELSNDDSDSDFLPTRKPSSSMKSLRKRGDKRQRSKTHSKVVASTTPARRSKRQKPNISTPQDAINVVGPKNVIPAAETQATSGRQLSILASTHMTTKDLASNLQINKRNSRQCSSCQNEYVELCTTVPGVASSRQVVCNSCSQWDPFYTAEETIPSSPPQYLVSRTRNIVLPTESENRFKPIRKMQNDQSGDTIEVDAPLGNINFGGGPDTYTTSPAVDYCFRV